jgi:acetyltransferase EpsM
MDVAIVGARGLGKELLGYLQQQGEHRVVCFLDELDVDAVLGVPVVHPERAHQAPRQAYLAIGYPTAKRSVLGKFASLKLDWQTFLHPSASVSGHATIGAGTLVGPMVALLGDCVLGRHVLVNAHGMVGHDARIGDCASLMPHAGLGGGAVLEDDVLLAMGARVLPGVTVGTGSRVSANAVVARDVGSGQLVFNRPAAVRPDLAARLHGSD